MLSANAVLEDGQCYLQMLFRKMVSVICYVASEDD
jgi:hypothetical protein